MPPSPNTGSAINAATSPEVAKRITSSSVLASALFPAVIAGDAQRSPSASVKAAVQSYEFMLAGVEAGELHCAFDGFCAAVAKKRLSQSAWSDLGNLLCKVRDRLHVIQIRAAVDQFVHLRFGGGNHTRIIVARVDHGDS